MVVISDTSAITNLIKIEQVEILKILFEEVIIPEAVLYELSKVDKNRETISSAGWIITKKVVDRALVEKLSKTLDSGESEALALAIDLSPDYVIIDKKMGRAIAEKFGIRKIGLIGILIKAKQHGIVDNVKSYLDQLINQADFFISDKLYKDVLYQLNEL